ncbi:MAG: Crp/Fnr family transcriptional regulator [Pseudomonadota bacterium]
MDSPNEAHADLALIEHSLRWTEGFSDWAPHALRQLAAGSRLGRHPRKALIASDSLQPRQTIAVVSGQMMVRSLAGEGSRYAIGLVGAGTVIGTGRLEVAGSPALEFHAHSDVTAIHIPTQLLIGLLDAEPQRWRPMLLMLLRQQRDLRASLMDRAIGGTRQRIAATVDRLAETYGLSEGADRSLRLRLSQEDLADLLQVSRQTVNRELRALAADGVLAADYNSLKILDRAALRFLALHGHAPGVQGPDL